MIGKSGKRYRALDDRRSHEGLNGGNQENGAIGLPSRK